MPTENRSSNTKMVSVNRELLARIEAALDRHMAGHAPMRIPADQTDSDLVREEVRQALAQPAQQGQGEPIMLTAVATLLDDGDGGLEPSWLLEGGTAELFAGMTLLVADNAPDLCSEDGSDQVYTHADPAEVERLRDIERGLRNTVDIANRTTKSVMRKLAERDALLSDIKRRHDGLHRDMATIAAREVPKDCTVAEYAAAAIADSLSASAEPSAPVETSQLLQELDDLYISGEALSADVEDDHDRYLEDNATTARFLLLNLDRIRAALGRKPSAPAVSNLPELTDELREILGRPNFTCHFIAKALRIMGHNIAPKSEDEQAVVIHWLIGHYLRHGADWRQRAESELKAASEKLKE